MRFLVDAQLPPALARWISSQGYVAGHVLDLATARTSDRGIWDYAFACSAVIVTKDQDIANRRAAELDGPPIVWLRCGNTRRNELNAWFERSFLVIIAALEHGETLIEIA